MIPLLQPWMKKDNGFFFARPITGTLEKSAYRSHWARSRVQEMRSIGDAVPT